MARIKLTLPTQFIFSTKIKVRITDVNYGGHMGNDAMLSFIHEARVQFFQSLGCSEINLFGASVIMGDVAIVYKAEAFQGEELIFELMADEFTTFGFDIFYRVSKLKKEETVLVAEAKTGMVCFDYKARKVLVVPTDFLNAVNFKKN